MTDLRVCESCGCHIRAGERACPFCDAPHLAAPQAAHAVVPRMSRARWLLLGSTLALGCASSSGGGTTLNPSTSASTGTDGTNGSTGATASAGTGGTGGIAGTGGTGAIAGTGGTSGTGGQHTCYGAPPARLERLAQALDPIV